MLFKLNRFLQRGMPILTPLSIVFGVFLEDIGSQLLFMVPWIFAFMTFASSLNMNLSGVKSFTKFPGAILIVLAVLHIAMPIVAYIVSIVLFDDPLLTAGFVLAVAIPTGVTSFIWVNICNGHRALCLSIILIDTMLSPIMIPALLKVFVGKTVELDTTSLMLDLVWMIVLPSIAGVLINELTKGGVEKTWSKTLAPFSKLAVLAVVMINGSAIAPYVKNLSWEIAGIIVIVFGLARFGYVLCFVLGRFFWKDTSVVTTFVLTGGMRNIAVGVVVATTYFPAKTVMPVVFGMLFQQVLASQVSRILIKQQGEISTP